MFEIVVEDEFPAAHFLQLYDGSWEQRHWHNWKVAVTMRAALLDAIGVVYDFEKLKPALRAELKQLEGLSLNEHPYFKEKKINTSAENIARYLFERLNLSVLSEQAQLTKVTVWETPNACASYLAAEKSK